MTKLIINPIEIKKINAEIKLRGNYEDLHLSITATDGTFEKYLIHNDERFKVKTIQDNILNKSENDDIAISEYKERNYLYITIGDKTMQVTGKKI